MAQNDAYIFDIEQISKEICGYLTLYVIPQQGKGLQIQILTKDIEEIIVELIRVTIDANTNELIPLHSRINSPTDIYASFCNKHQLGIDILKSVINNCVSYKYITDILDKAIEPATFIQWSITKRGCVYVLESYGDFRINSWMKEHIDENGKYVECKIKEDLGLTEYEEDINDTILNEISKSNQSQYQTHKDILNTSILDKKMRLYALRQSALTKKH